MGTLVHVIVQPILSFHVRIPKKLQNLCATTAQTLTRSANRSKVARRRDIVSLCNLHLVFARTTAVPLKPKPSGKGAGRTDSAPAARLGRVQSASVLREGEL